jgi:hypothetical protein
MNGIRHAYTQIILLGGNPSSEQVAKLLKEHLSVVDTIVCDVMPAKKVCVVDIHLINRGCIAPPIGRIHKVHGEYRQFEKRDKRKHFRR